MQESKLTAEEMAYYEKIYGEPCYSSNQQYVRVISMMGKNPKLPSKNEANIYCVSDSMTMRKLMEKWYENNQTQYNIQSYMLMYEDEFPLDDSETIMDLKSKLGTQILPKNFMIRVYEKQQCPLKKDESSLTEEQFLEFQKNHRKSIEIPIKIHINEKQSYYFYINGETEIKINSLHKKITDELKGNLHPVRCDSLVKYTLWVCKDSISDILTMKLEKKKISIKNILKDNRITLDNQLNDFSVRDLCCPGQVVNLSFSTPCFQYEAAPSKYNSTIRIFIYKKIEKEQKLRTHKFNLEKKVIERNLYEVSKMKISTLLKEEGVEDPLLTSVYLNGQVIRPMIKFEDISSIDNYIINNLPIEFVCIPENFLYYQELSEIARLNDDKTMKDILDEIPKKKFPVSIQSKDRDEYVKIRDKKLEKLRSSQNLKKEHKELNFLDPIMVYTSSMIYQQLNAFLRETSISLFNQDEIVHQYWHYSVCQKIVESLLKLQNFKGIVYRGSKKFQYNCKVGETIQLNFFTSTSKQKQKTRIFLQGKQNPYLFQIKTFSGKEIKTFSMYEYEDEVLILPYTKFKVLHVKKTSQYTLVQLLEIPIPKKIPGHIVVWIDANIEENSGYFNQFVADYGLKDFDLIQLESNEHFIIWLNQFKHILEMPNVKLHFITNMNRPPNYLCEGIETLKIIRSFNPTAKVLFFIGNVVKSWENLKKAGKNSDPNINVISNPQELKKIFLQEFLGTNEKIEAQNYYHSQNQKK